MILFLKANSDLLLNTINSLSCLNAQIVILWIEIVHYSTVMTVMLLHEQLAARSGVVVMRCRKVMYPLRARELM